jgi:hypothetical protein
MEQYGLDVSIRQAGIDFANSGYPLWHANEEGRRNLRNGIAPPDCSHPQFNVHADDIDYQIEADFSGLIAPGLPNIVIALGDKFGRLMNYGDGVYAGIFVGAMYAEAFFETDVIKIIRTALQSIPEDSQYAEMVRDMLQWYGENPDEWEQTWQKVESKYHDNLNYRRVTCNAGSYNIDAKINGAYILMGLLYGKGDLDRTIVISTRCGQDSDCNPSNAGGVLFTTLGFSKLPPRFSEKLDESRKFSHTEYNFPLLLDVCEKLARQAVIKQGGRIEKDANGEEYFVIPVAKPLLTPTMKSWDPLPIDKSLFTDEERSQIKYREFRTMQDAVSHHFPGWIITDCGSAMNPGILPEFRGKENVFLTHPKGKGVPCILSREIELPQNRESSLLLSVSYHPQGDWDLVVKINGKEILKQTIGSDKKKDWTDLKVNLSKYAGQKVKIELLNMPNGWSYEAGYWSQIEIQNK